MISLFKFFIRFYQRYLSPLLGTRCRFSPSCSEYMYQALDHHGFFKGTGLGMMRLCRCHPFHAGGHDPVARQHRQD